MTKEEKSNIFSWFFFVIFVPFLFLLIVIYTAFTIAGYDVSTAVDKSVRTFPVIGSYLNTSEVRNKLKNAEYELAKTKEELKRSEIAKTLLQEELDKKKKELTQLNDTINKLQKISGERDVEKAKLEKQLVEIMQSMDARIASDIINQLPTKDALAILKLLPSEFAGNVIANLEPKKAAEILKQLTPS